MQILNKKKKLQQFFKESIEEKKRFELELKRDEEFEDRAAEIYQRAKDRIKKLEKSITLKEKEEKARQAQIIGICQSETYNYIFYLALKRILITFFQGNNIAPFKPSSLVKLKILKHSSRKL